MTKADEEVAAPVNPEAAAIAAARAEQEAPAPQLVGVDAFVRFTFGAKNIDQSAAFLRWARKNNHRKCTVEQWRELLTAFQNKPIGG